MQPNTKHIHSQISLIVNLSTELSSNEITFPVNTCKNFVQVFFKKKWVLKLRMFMYVDLKKPYKISVNNRRGEKICWSLINSFNYSLEWVKASVARNDFCACCWSITPNVQRYKSYITDM